MSDAPRFSISPHHGAPTSFGRWYFITAQGDGPICDVIAGTEDDCLTRARLICAALNAHELRELEPKRPCPSCARELLPVGLLEDVYRCTDCPGTYYLPKGCTVRPPCNDGPCIGFLLPGESCELCGRVATCDCPRDGVRCDVHEPSPGAEPGYCPTCGARIWTPSERTPSGWSCTGHHGSGCSDFVPEPPKRGQL